MDTTGVSVPQEPSTKSKVHSKVLLVFLIILVAAVVVVILLSIFTGTPWELSAKKLLTTTRDGDYIVDYKETRYGKRFYMTITISSVKAHINGKDGNYLVLPNVKFSDMKVSNRYILADTQKINEHLRYVWFELITGEFYQSNKPLGSDVKYLGAFSSKSGYVSLKFYKDGDYLNNITFAPGNTVLKLRAIPFKKSPSQGNKYSK